MRAGGSILTVTPNPSLDLLYTADRLVWDDANRVPEPRIRPGGQGINVARAVGALGRDVEAVTLLGGAIGAEIRLAMAGEPVRLHVVEADADTRIFVSVTEGASGRSLHLNNPGPRRSAGEETAFLARVEALIEQGRPAWVACCGSVPPGFGPDLYRRVGALARARGCAWLPDCDGVPLLEAIRDGCDLLVPNRLEAARLLGRPVTTPADAVRAARELLSRARTGVAVTLGSGGAVLATPDSAWYAVLDPPLPGVAVGAGDAFLAALLVALQAGRAPDAALADAVAAGASTLLSKGTGLLDPADFDAVRQGIRVTAAG